jgi:hypothetical protein
MSVARILLTTGKVLLTSNKNKIKQALEKGGRKISKRESDKRLKIKEGADSATAKSKPQRAPGSFGQKDDKSLKIGPTGGGGKFDPFMKNKGGMIIGKQKDYIKDLV